MKIAKIGINFIEMMIYHHHRKYVKGTRCETHHVIEKNVKAFLEIDQYIQNSMDKNSILKSDKV